MRLTEAKQIKRIIREEIKRMLENHDDYEQDLINRYLEKSKKTNPFDANRWMTTELGQDDQDILNRHFAREAEERKKKQIRDIARGDELGSIYDNEQKSGGWQAVENWMNSLSPEDKEILNQHLNDRDARSRQESEKSWRRSRYPTAWKQEEIEGPQPNTRYSGRWKKRHNW